MGIFLFYLLPVFGLLFFLPLVLIFGENIYFKNLSSYALLVRVQLFELWISAFGLLFTCSKVRYQIIYIFKAFALQSTEALSLLA